MASERNGESPFVSIQVLKTDANWYIFFRLHEIYVYWSLANKFTES